jgi:hypothetical protein
VKTNQRNLLIMGAILFIAIGWWLTTNPLSKSSVDKVGLTSSVSPSLDRPKDLGNLSDDKSTTDPGAVSTQAPSETSSVNSETKKQDLTHPEQQKINSPTDVVNKPVDAQAPITDVPQQNVSFPGIKQGMSDVMLAQLRHTAGNGEDSFIATFQRIRGGAEFFGNVWIIGDYVQRGTTELMAMPSHAGLSLSPDGAPKNPDAGVRFLLEGGTGTTVSKRFTIKRPGFEGEELSMVRVGIFDRKSGITHIAKVSAAQWSKKRSTKRAKVGLP